ncbi:unnamed protein product [Haemonchus placei]|uniref:Uncharacterized protein n=1 Tax=Haemonchus placei TaxID=6290 RepID=A0A3P7UT53_HAEPC|nr:unnamed protein product [Haemonchus placei]
MHLAADGSYDSRGYSALIGKVVLAEARTKLVLHTEVLHRSETGTTSDGLITSISTRMEVEGLRRLMRWVQAQGLQIGSVTTDRSRALGAALREMEPQIGAIPHYYDGWHLAKWLGNELRKVSKLDGCDEIGAWIEKLKTHLWNAIEYAADSNTDVRAIFNTCLMHVKDVHEWPLVNIFIILLATWFSASQTISGRPDGSLHSLQSRTTGGFAKGFLCCRE